MSKRTSRRSAPDPPSIPEPNRRSRSSRNEVKAESIEPENDPGPSKRARPSLRARTKTADEPFEDDEEKVYSVRERKSVSYREVPVIEDDEEVDDLSSAGEEKDDTPPPRKSAAPDTPSKRRKSAVEDDEADKAFKADKVGSGRGGFSVKGAAAAAARARWAKVRLAKEERGEVDDDSKERKKGRVVRRENRAAVEKLKVGTKALMADGETLTIRGVEYVVKNDELPIPDDPKGETKIDALGHLKGGREYKIFTFSSDGRDNNEILYALTIDVARTCGYSDSLAFLRRYPVIQKLQCQPGEAEMLVEVGRVAGNMKHRMVTIVPIHNVFKLMGARIIKDGKWVTDDYYEDECLAKCAENGFTPYAPVQEEEIAAATHGVAGIRGDREREQLIAISKTNALSPFYTLGGPSTHFGGAGIDPWSDGGYGNKRARLRGAGVTAEDWMYKTALESRGIDQVLKGYREERVGLLEGKDLNGWVWNTEERTDRPSKTEIAGGESPNIKPSGLKPPTMDRQRSGLSREVTFEPEPTVFEPERQRGEGEEYKDWVNQEYDNSMEMIKEVDEPNGANTSALTSLSEIVMSTTKDEIRVETEQEALERRAKYSYGAGGWFHGSIKAAYEPHTQMPHIPLYTQPTTATYRQLSSLPIISTQKQITAKAAKGIASLEYVFEPQYPSAEVEMRERVIKEAEEWERENRRKRLAL